MNAAAGLVVSEKSNNFKEAYNKLREHILSGVVIKHVEKIEKMTDILNKIINDKKINLEKYKKNLLSKI